ncbi:MAG: hypothetical protein JO138_20500 [Acidobacteriaceae bacterium]|nr:hypothetical protein [Acidobacteriaceae bacterium]
MLRTRMRFVFVALLVSSFVAATPQADLAQGDWHHPRRDYSVESLRGDYAAVATYGANVARALGTQTLDGVGNLKGSAIVNQPGLNGARTIVSITFTGTYTVNSDGTGTMSLTIMLPNGKTANATEDFVITKAKILGGIPIATEIIDAQEQPSTVIPGGVFVTHTYTRRSE